MFWGDRYKMQINNIQAIVTSIWLVEKHKYKFKILLKLNKV